MGVRVIKTVNGKTRSVEIECADFDKFNEIVEAMPDESTDRLPIGNNVVIDAKEIWRAARAVGIERVYEHVSRMCQPDEIEDATASYAWWAFVIVMTLVYVSYHTAGPVLAELVFTWGCVLWIAAWVALKHTHRMPTRLTRQARYERALLAELAKLQRRHGDVLALAGDGDISEVDHATRER